MNEEVKPVEVAGEQPKEPKVEESKETKTEGENIDYKALFEQEQARRQKAESVIQRHKKPKDEEIEEDSEVSEPDSIREVIREELDVFKSTISSQLRGKEIVDAISRATSNSQEADLIRYHYDNSIRQTGDIDLDIENAKALANKKRVQVQLEEMKASISSKENRSTGSPMGRKSAQEAPDDALPHLTEVDRKNIDWLREKYVLSNNAVNRILKGERLDDLLSKGVIKKR